MLLVLWTCFALGILRKYDLLLIEKSILIGLRVLDQSINIFELITKLLEFEVFLLTGLIMNDLLRKILFWLRCLFGYLYVKASPGFSIFLFWLLLVCLLVKNNRLNWLDDIVSYFQSNLFFVRKSLIADLLSIGVSESLHG